MDHRPTQWEKHHTIPLQAQLVEFPQGRSTGTLDPCENRLDLNVDQLTASSIGDSELEPSHTAIWRYDRIPAVDDSRRRAGEPGENHPCCQRDTDDVQQRL